MLQTSFIQTAMECPLRSSGFNCDCRICLLGREHRLAAIPIPQVPIKFLTSLQSVATWNASEVADLMYYYKISETLFSQAAGEELKLDAVRCRIKPDTYKQGNKVMYFRAGIWTATMLIPYVNEMSYFFKTVHTKSTSEVMNLAVEMFSVGMNACELLDTPADELGVRFDAARMNEVRQIAFCSAIVLSRSFSSHLYPVLQYTKVDTHRVLACVMGMRTEEHQYVPFEVETYVWKEKRSMWKDFLKS